MGVGSQMFANVWRDRFENEVTYCFSHESVAIPFAEQFGDIKIDVDLLEKLDSSFLIQTSGSSGAAKWVVHSKECLLRHAELVNIHLSLAENDVFGLLLPAYHVGGLGVIARALVAGAGLVAYDGKWSASACVEFINTHKVSVLSLVPAQVVDLVNAELPCPKCVRIAVVGGGGLDLKVKAVAEKLGWQVYVSYGMSETGSQIATGSLGDENSDGYLKLIDGWSVDTGAGLGGGVLRVKGECLFKGYLKSANEQLKFVNPKENGWFESSDLVDVKEGDGEVGLKFVGRADLQVKILGELVDIFALEAKLQLMVKGEVFLVPIFDERRGVRLFPVVCDGGTLERMREVEWQGLYRLEEVVWVDEFPKNEMGKLQRVKLTELVETVVFSAG